MVFDPVWHELNMMFEELLSFVRNYISRDTRHRRQHGRRLGTERVLKEVKVRPF